MKTPATCILLLIAGPLLAADRPYDAMFSSSAVRRTAARGPVPNCTTPAGPQCHAYPGQCRGPCPYCKPPCPGEEERAPGQPEAAPGMREVGAFVAPPRVGAMRSAVLRRGIEGGAITLPEIRLKLPSIELPCTFHSRSQARMEIEGAVAPWESHGYVATGAGEFARQQEGAPESAKEKCSASERAAKESAAAEDYARQLKEYERLLKQCEQQQQELRECIRRCLENHPGAAPSDSAPRGNERSPVQKPIGNPQEQQWYPPAPEVDPSARLLPPVYPERPAVYSGEQPAAAVPRPLIIREPQPPSGRITGLRPLEQ